MAVTEKISVTIGRDELKHAKKLAHHLGLSLSTFISSAVRDRIEEEARREAAQHVLASFAHAERATPAEMRALLERWEVGQGEASSPRGLTQQRPRPRRRKKPQR